MHSPESNRPVPARAEDLDGRGGRVTPFGSPPLLHIGGLEISAVGIAQAAQDIMDYCRSDARRTSSKPVFVTSVNGHVLSMCARDPPVQRLFAQADVIHCDGQPLVLLSRTMGKLPLPERVATTDLFPVTAELAARHNVTFYLLGASREVNRRAVDAARSAYPGLAIVGASHGYLSQEEERAVVDEIARLKPDVLWVALGVPLEQRFVVRHWHALKGVGVVKTSGGLFDFMSGRLRRAPRWMQRVGIEWLFRLALEPGRLFLRYALTNPHAAYLIVRSLRRRRA